jgi:hypothetical protein
MADSFITSQMPPPLPVTSPKLLQRALLESARQLSAETAQFAYEWQGAWPDPTVADALEECVEAMRVVIDRLVVEFGRAEGPLETEAAGLIGALLGTTTEPGPLRRMQALARCDETSASPEQHKLLGEVEVLRLQFTVLRTEWQDYLSLLTALHRVSGPQPLLRSLQPAAAADGLSALLPALPHPEAVPEEAPLTLPLQEEMVPVDGGARLLAFLLVSLSTATPPGATGWGAAGLLVSPPGGLVTRQPTEAFSVAPMRRRRLRMSEHVRRGLRETFTICATLGAVLLVIISVAYLAVTHLPDEQNAPAATPAQTITAPLATAPPNPTSPPQPLPTRTPFVPPTSTPTTQPTATMPATPGLAQLAVNPPVLLVPCPGGGAGTLQLVNTGVQPLNWQASVSSLSGGNPGIALDVAQGHLEADGVAFINVTALARGAQGAITLGYTGAANPAMVTYSVSC